jgi:ABC-2 type transport system ATP-binding protein
VVTPDAGALAGILRGTGATVVADGPDGLSVTGMESRDVGILAAEASLTLYELSTQRASLEDAFMDLTREQADFRVTTGEPSAVRAVSAA